KRLEDILTTVVDVERGRLPVIGQHVGRWLIEYLVHRLYIRHHFPAGARLFAHEIWAGFAKPLEQRTAAIEVKKPVRHEYKNCVRSYRKSEKNHKALE